MSGYRNFTFVLQAGEAQRFAYAGYFYRVLASTGTVSVGTDSDDMHDVPVGIGVHEPSGFKALRIENTSGGMNTITFAVGLGAIDDSRLSLDTGAALTVNDGGGSLTVDGAVVVNNLPTTYPDGLTEITRKGFSQIGASFSGAACFSGTTTLISAASNTAGLVIRQAAFDIPSGNVTVYADTAPGSTYDDYSKRALVTVAAGSKNSVLTYADLFFPAGIGLFVVTSVTIYARVNYDLL